MAKKAQAKKIDEGICPEEQKMFNVLCTMKIDDLKRYRQEVLAVCDGVKSQNCDWDLTSLANLFSRMTIDELKQCRQRFVVVFGIVERRHKQDPRRKRRSNYAVKSFQAQDMSGRFNRSRMNRAIKEAKPGVNHGN